MTHSLKCWPGPYADVLALKKRFEWRRDDRGFRVGDDIVLNEFNPTTKQYSGRWLKGFITYKLSGGQFDIPTGFCILGFVLADGFQGD